MSEPLPRPGLVTMAGWMIIGGAVLMIVTVFETVDATTSRLSRGFASATKSDARVVDGTLTPAVAPGILRDMAGGTTTFVFTSVLRRHWRRATRRARDAPLPDVRTQA